MPHRDLRLVLLVSLGALTVMGCAQNINQIVTCTTDDDCPRGYCDEVALICLAGQRECDVDRECGAPAGICERGKCVAGCPVGACGLGETCNVATGRCRFLQSCTIDSQCNPPDRICLEDYCEPGCSVTGCATGSCDPYSGHCQGGGGCTLDSQCSPPATICEDPVCVAGCATTGCGANLACNQATGRCDPVGPLLADGQDCLSDAACQSGLCTEVDILNPPSQFRVCSRACCTENDCAAHHACLYHRGVKQCIPDRIFPAPYFNNFTASAGAICGNAGPFCRSGYCIPADAYNPTSTCGTTCCAAADCGGGECVWYPDGSGFMFELCAGTSPTGHTGTACDSEYDCASLICVGVCADMCCSNSDCPNGTVCAQVLSGQTEPMVTTACLSGGGAIADGNACTPGDAPSVQCDSGLCAAGTCRRPCCHDLDCPTGQTCEVVPSGIDIDNDGSGDFVRACIP
jgi:hypothetical protein